MKIAVTANGSNLAAAMDRRFGRAGAFIVFDIADNSFSVIKNIQNLNAVQGAGIQAAQTIVNAGAAALITGHCGPKAFRVLKAAGVKVFNSTADTVAEAIELYNNGELAAAENADVEGHWL